jgi:N-terminal acetyltransferase 2
MLGEQAGNPMSAKVLANFDFTGEWEHQIVSHVKAAIPDSVKKIWREWRTSMKQGQNDIPGGKQVEKGVEMAGWGVEEAEKQNKAKASTYSTLSTH